MNCVEIHNVLNAPVSGGMLAYQEMTHAQIAELLAKAECPIARARGENIRLGSWNIDPKKQQGYVMYHCPQARDGGFGGIVQKINCHATGSACTQDGSHGDLELGVSVDVRDEYPEL